MISLDNSFTNDTSRRKHLWESDLEFAPVLPLGWTVVCESKSCSRFRAKREQLLRVEGTYKGLDPSTLPASEQTRHMKYSPDQILALAFR